MGTGGLLIRTLALNRKWWLLLLALWGVAVGVSFWFTLQDIRRHNLALSVEGARNMFEMVVLTRAWNASHGGVYVPISEKAQPNPYLVHPERDITTVDGRRYTLINPAYMTRQIAELAREEGGVIFHITSLKPIRPANAADPWERTALLTFERGEQEHYSFEQAGQQRLLRYMAPLMVKKSCMPCHANQGYQVGDVRGGVSITQRYERMQATGDVQERQALLLHLLVFTLLAAVSWWLLVHLRQSWLQLESKIEELESTRGQLLQSEKMASLGRMVAGFAHEINTPVGVGVGALSQSDEILDGIDRLLQQEEVDEADLLQRLGDLREGSTLALSNLRRAAELVQRFKRASVDQSSEQERHFEMGELIDDVRFSLTNALKRRPLAIRVACPEGIRIYGIPGMLEQVLTNLIVNSLNYGFGDDFQEEEIQISVEPLAGRWLRITYRDNGKGMAPEVQERIFEPFYTTHREGGGSGLGMYLCYNIVTNQLGGRIRCESAPGEGALFEIEIPYRSSPEDEQESTP